MASPDPQRSQQCRARKHRAVPETPHPHPHWLRVTFAPCPLWAVPKIGAWAWLSMSGVGSVCRRSRPPGPHSPQGCWRDDCSSCLPAWGCLHGQLVSWARPGGQRGKGWWALPPTAVLQAPTLPCGLYGEKWGPPGCVREGGTEQSPSHQCPCTGHPQDMAPCSLQMSVVADQSPNNWAMASHPPAQLGKLRPGSQGPGGTRLWT